MVARIVARRAFSTTRAQLASPYHYPEGPRSNLPFNTKTRFFALRYWGFMVTGFFAPFGIAGTCRLWLDQIPRSWKMRIGGRATFGSWMVLTYRQLGKRTSPRLN